VWLYVGLCCQHLLLGGLPLCFGGLLHGHGGVVGRLRRVLILIRDDAALLQQDRTAEFILGVLNRHLGLENRGVGIRHAGLGAGQVSLGPLDQGPPAHHRRFGDVEAGARLRDTRFEGLGIDARHELPLLHPGVEVRVKPQDDAGDLCAHLHRDHGVGAASGRNRVGDAAAIDRGGAVLSVAMSAEDRPTAGHGKDAGAGHPKQRVAFRHGPGSFQSHI
jgi:hypothetical protein